MCGERRAEIAVARFVPNTLQQPVMTTLGDYSTPTYGAVPPAPTF